MAKYRETGILNFASVCRELLREYGEESHEIIKEVVPDAADIAVKMIRSNSKKRTGAYAKDWAKKEFYARAFGCTYTVYNRKHYRVAHLLENPHPFRNQYSTAAISWPGDGVIGDAEAYTAAWLESEVTKRLG